jgi:hypothetical protein
MKNSVERSVYTKLLTLLGFVILSGASISG